MRIYPKSVAHLSYDVLASANARAERWKKRYENACAERDAYKKRLEEKS